MSDLEDLARNFLQRWSQRKGAAENNTPDNADLSPDDKAVDSNAAAQGVADPPVFDPATLPSIESITATSDIRAFLTPGVPEELTRAALRRVWVTDPPFGASSGLPRTSGISLSPTAYRALDRSNPRRHCVARF